MLKLFWQTRNPVSRFENCEDGAVTADWVVLSAAIVIFGSVMIGIYRDGVYDVASSISDALVESAPTPADSPWQ